MEVRAKKSLGQHFLTDLSIARRIAEALEVGAGLTAGAATQQQSEAAPKQRNGEAPQQQSEAAPKQRNGAAKPQHPVPEKTPVLEVGPGMGVLTQFLLQRDDIAPRMVEIDRESVDYLLMHFPGISDKLIMGDFLRLKLEDFFSGDFCIIGNFPYNISSQIFFKVLDYKDHIPQVVGMVQKEVAERIAEKPGSKVYGILSVLLQAWYDIEYLFTVGEGAFNPPPKVKSAVIRLKRNSRESLGCDESLFKAVVKTSFNQRRKTLRNSLKPLLNGKLATLSDEAKTELLSSPVFDLRPEQLGVEEFIALTRLIYAK